MGLPALPQIPRLPSFESSPQLRSLAGLSGRPSPFYLPPPDGARAAAAEEAGPAGFFKGFGRSFGAGLTEGAPRAIGSSIEVAGRLLDDEQMTQYGAGFRGGEPTYHPSIAGITDIPGASLGDTLRRGATWAGETLGSGMASTAAPLAAGAVGTLLGGPLAGLASGAAAAVPSLALNIGDTYEMARDAGIDPDRAAQAAVAGGVPAAVLDIASLGTLSGPLRKMLLDQAGRKALAVAATKSAEVAAQEAAKRGLAGTIGHGALEGALSEGVTESLQQAIQEGVVADAANRPFFTPEVGKSILEAGLAGALTGGVMEGGGAGVAKARGDIQQREADTALQTSIAPALSARSAADPLAPFDLRRFEDAQADARTLDENDMLAAATQEAQFTAARRQTEQLEEEERVAAGPVQDVYAGTPPAPVAVAPEAPIDLPNVWEGGAPPPNIGLAQEASPLEQLRQQGAPELWEEPARPAEINPATEPEEFKAIEDARRQVDALELGEARGLAQQLIDAEQDNRAGTAAQEQRFAEARDQAGAIDVADTQRAVQQLETKREGDLGRLRAIANTTPEDQLIKRAVDELGMSPSRAQKLVKQVDVYDRLTEEERAGLPQFFGDQGLRRPEDREAVIRGDVKRRFPTVQAAREWIAEQRTNKKKLAEARVAPTAPLTPAPAPTESVEASVDGGATADRRSDSSDLRQLVDDYTAGRGEIPREQIAAALEMLRRDVTTDPLTGLRNKRWWDLHHEQAKDTPVVVIDLKKFKAINDKLGHKAGDKVLQVVGEILKRFQSETSARFGGDEFGMILNGTTLEEAESMVEQLRLAFAGEIFTLKRGDHSFDIQGIEAHIGLARGQEAADQAQNAAAADSRAGGRGDTELPGAAPVAEPAAEPADAEGARGGLRDRVEPQQLGTLEPPKTEAVPGGAAPAEKTSTPAPPRAQPVVSKNTIVTDEAAERFRAVLREKLHKAKASSAGLEPDVVVAGIGLSIYHIERGARTFAAYSKAMIDDMGEMVRAYLGSWYMAVKRDPSAAAFRAEMDTEETVDAEEAKAAAALTTKAVEPDEVIPPPAKPKPATTSAVETRPRGGRWTFPPNFKDYMVEMHVQDPDSPIHPEYFEEAWSRMSPASREYIEREYAGAPPNEEQERRAAEEAMQVADGMEGFSGDGLAQEGTDIQGGINVTQALVPTDTAAHEAATSPRNELPEPTEAQKEAGNYPKGHVRIAGLDISIENPAGSKRREEWPELKSHYGYIRGFIGKDKEHIDTFIKAGTPTDYNGPAYVVNQTTADGVTFDEHKVMIGWKTEDEARAAYLENFTPGWNRYTGLNDLLTMDELKRWLKNYDLTKPAPLSYASKKAAVARYDELKAAESKKPASTGIVVKFAKFPSQAIRDILKNVGFRWNKDEESWKAPDSPRAQDAARQALERGATVTGLEKPSAIEPVPGGWKVGDKVLSPGGGASKHLGGPATIVALTPPEHGGPWTATVEYTNGRREERAVSLLSRPEDVIDVTPQTAETVTPKPDKAKLIPVRTEGGGTTYVAKPITRAAATEDDAKKAVSFMAQQHQMEPADSGGYYRTFEAPPVPGVISKQQIVIRIATKGGDWGIKVGSIPTGLDPVSRRMAGIGGGGVDEFYTDFDQAKARLDDIIRKTQEWRDKLPSAPAKPKPSMMEKAPPGGFTAADTVRSDAQLEKYAKAVVADGVKSVTLVGSRVKGASFRDTDILYDLGDRVIPQATAAAEETVEGIIEGIPSLDLDSFDSFFKVGDRYFHVSAGAGREVVENTEYGRNARFSQRPERVLARVDITPKPAQADSGVADVRKSEPAQRPASGDQAPLAGAPAADVSRPGEERPARPGDQPGVRPDGGRDARPSGQERPIESSVGGGETGLGTPAAKPGAKPPVRVASVPEGRASRGVDYRITDANDLGAGGPIGKARSNIAAIETLQAIEKEGRLATPEEQAKLVGYVGWGALPRAFQRDYAEKSWVEIQEKLRTLLTPEEYAAARRSTQNAHYTSKDVVSAMWSALERLGVTKDVALLEPAVGIGHFLGLQPEGLLPAQRTAVELDPLSARIAKQLYQRASVINKAFQQANLPRDHYDVVVSNVPFARIPINDPRFRKSPEVLKSLHDYYFAKSIDLARPGGVLALISTHYTLDKKDGSVRKYIADRADFIGAIRLPNTAFKGNAGTEVVTDIIFLRKKSPDSASLPAVEWQKLGTVDAKQRNGQMGPTSQNEYFVAHPEMILGTPENTGEMYAGREEGEYTVRGELTPEALAKAIERLPQNVFAPATATDSTTIDTQAIRSEVGTGDEIKPNAYAVKDGALVVRRGEFYEAHGLNAKDEARVRGQVGIRDALRKLLSLQLEDAPEQDIKAAQKRLGSVYDAYVGKNGPLNDRPNARAFQEDPDAPLLRALEEWNPDKKTAKKTSVFTERTIQPYRPAATAANAPEALLITLAERGRIDVAHMRKLTGKTDAELQAELGDAVYINPEGSHWETKDEYLSGNVRAKLEAARTAAEQNPEYERNVKALEKVIPEDLPPGDIDARLGSPWIPPADVARFLAETLGGNAPTVWYNKEVGSWAIEASGLKWLASATETWGSPRANAVDLVEDALNLKSTIVRDRHTDGSSTVNPDETTLAQEKQQKLRDEFRKWVWKDTDRATRLARHYNDTFNNIAPRVYDGSHLRFPGMARLTLRNNDLEPHQKAAAWRIITMDPKDGLLLNHGVGAGKTFAVIAGIMEARRMGLVNKGLITVPNHLVSDWGREFLRLYPNAKVMVAGKDTWGKDRREETMSRIATQNWDAVIVSLESFKRIPLKKETTEAFLREQIAEIEAAILAAEAEAGPGGKNKTVKQLEAMKERIEARIDKLLSADTKDAAVNFEDLGVDLIAADEAHNYKNLYTPTKLSNLNGIPRSASQRAMDMFIKARWTANRRGRIVFATATPVSNTLGEAFVFQRYLQPDALRDRGLQSFDAWAGAFGEVITSVELAPDGSGYRQNTRFAQFTNVPELSAMLAQTMDTKLTKDLDLPRPKLEGDKPVIVKAPASPALETYVKLLIERAKAVKERRVEPEEDNMLKITGDGRKAALDLRLVLPGRPDDPNSKVNKMVKNLYDVWRETKAKSLTQLVFLDLSTPKGEKAKTTKATAVEAEETDVTDENPEDVELAEEEATAASVYEDIRNKLVKLGVPRADIEFIHDANTDAKKQALYSSMNAGRVRIMLASSNKGGVGMNVQKKLFAIHHLDGPWRPDQVEQRNGRIVRQGNENESIREYRYVTEKSFDAYTWQTLERKLRFVEDFMNAKPGVRRVEDSGAVILSYAEMKAAASGNPLVLEKVALDAELNKIHALRRGHDDAQFRRKRDLAFMETRLPGLEKVLAAATRDTKEMVKPEPFSANFGGETYIGRQEAGEALFAEIVSDKTPLGDQKVGVYGGAPVVVRLVEKDDKDFEQIKKEWDAAEKQAARELGLNDAKRAVNEASTAQRDFIKESGWTHKQGQEIPKELAALNARIEAAQKEENEVREKMAARAKEIVAEQRQAGKAGAKDIGGAWLEGPSGAKYKFNISESPGGTIRSMETQFEDGPAGDVRQYEQYIREDAERTAELRKALATPFEKDEREKELTTRLKELNAALDLDKKNAEGDEAPAGVAEDPALEAMRAEIGRTAPRKTGSGSDLMGKLKAQADAAKKRIKDRGRATANELGSAAAHGAGTFADLTVIGAHKIASGLREFGAWAKSMVEDLAGAIPNLGTWLRRIFAASQRNVEREQPGSENAPPPPTPAARPVTTPRDPADPYHIPDETKTEELQRIFQDQYNRVEKTQRTVEQQGGVETRNLRDVFEAKPSRVEARLEQADRELVDPLVDSIKRAGAKVEDLSRYMDLLHKPDRDRIIAERTKGENTEGSGISAEAADHFWTQLEQAYGRRNDEGRIEKLEASRRIVRDIIDKTIANQVASGELTAEMADKLQERWGEHYIPQETVEEDDTPGTGVGFDVASRPVQYAGGRYTPAFNSVAVAVARMQKTIDRAERNRGFHALVEFVAANPGLGWKFDKEHTTTRPRRVFNVRDAAGEIVKSYPSRKAAEEASKPGQTVEPGFENQEAYDSAAEREEDVRGWIDGERLRVNIPDPLFRAAVKNMGGAEMNRAVRTLGKFTRYYSKINTALSPVFVLRNLVKDLQTAGLSAYAEKGGDVGKDVLRGVPAAIRAMWGQARNPDAPAADGSTAAYAREFKKHGGPAGYYSMSNAMETAKALEARLKRAGPGGLQAALRFGDALGDLISDANGAVENGTRLAAYIAMRKRGAPIDKSIAFAKNLTVNFQRRGEIGPVMNSLYAFFNPSVQGAKRLVEVLRSDRGKAVAAGLFGLGVALDILNRAAAGDDDDDGTNDYDQISEFVKERNLIIPTGGRPLMIPLPYGFNAIMSLGRNTAAVALGKKKPGEAVANVAGAAFSAFNPLGSDSTLLQFFAPTVLDPLAQVAENKSWSGSPLMPSTFPGDKRPDSELFFKTVSPTARELARFLNLHTGGSRFRSGWIDVSPETIELAVDYALGAAGKFAHQAFDLGATVASGETPSVRKTPFLSSFVYEEHPAASNARFMELTEEVERLTSEYKAAREAGDKDEQRRVGSNKLFRAGDYIKGIEKQVASIKKEIRVRGPKGIGVKQLEAKVGNLERQALKIAAQAQQ